MAGNKKLLFLLNTKQSLEYTASGSGGGKDSPGRVCPQKERHEKAGTLQT